MNADRIEKKILLHAARNRVRCQRWRLGDADQAHREISGRAFGRLKRQRLALFGERPPVPAARHTHERGAQQAADGRRVH
jgi:hypothetical protein